MRSRTLVGAGAVALALVTGASGASGLAAATTAPPTDSTGPADSPVPADSTAPTDSTTSTDSTVAGDDDFSDLGAVPDDKVQPADVDWGDLGALEQRLFTVLSEVDETFRTKAAEVWSDDYRFDQTPIAFAVRGDDGEVETVYVAHHPDGASLPGAQRVELDDRLGLGDVYRIDVPDNFADYGEAPFVFAADVGGTSSMLIFVQLDDPMLSATTWDWARFIVHETFHRYQLEDARWAVGMPDGAEYPRDTENAALAMLEDRVLKAMTTSSDPVEVERRLGQFLAIRAERNASFDLGDREDVQEAAEGTARYVENRYAELLGRSAGWEGDPSVAQLEVLSFGRFYSTGAQLGWALDELGVDWKQRVADGESLVDIATEALGGTTDPALVDDAKQEFDFDALTADADAADLENAEEFNPSSGSSESGASSEGASSEGASAEMLAELKECLTEQGIDVEPDADASSSTVADQPTDGAMFPVDASDPAVVAALQACGVQVSDVPADTVDAADTADTTDGAETTDGAGS